MMKIAAAQTIPFDGDINANVRDHIRLADMAADYGVQLIVFPELSLTGYMREGAQTYAFVQGDIRLQQLKQLSTERNIVIVAGAPIEIDAKLYIGAFILQPNNVERIYTKQFLHEGEEVTFVPGLEHNPVIELDGERISFAVCADINYPQHAANAANANTTLYVAGIFYTPLRIGAAHEQLSTYAQQHNMHVLMANYGGPSYNMDAGGRSACWNNKGELINELNESEEGVLFNEIVN